MIALLHVGYQPGPFDPAWANTGGDMTVLRQLGVSQGHQWVELMLNGMIFGGFRPPPGPYRDDRGVRASTGSRAAGRPRWIHRHAHVIRGRALPRRPTRSTCLRRSSSAATSGSRRFRVHQSPAALLDRYPECVVFSSDFNHNDGAGPPTAYYRECWAASTPRRRGLPRRQRRRVFARMGDPLPHAARGAVARTAKLFGTSPARWRSSPDRPGNRPRRIAGQGLAEAGASVVVSSRKQELCDEVAAGDRRRDGCRVPLGCSGLHVGD